MSDSYSSGATNARTLKVCPKCKSTERKWEGHWPSQTIKCKECDTILGYTK